MKNHKDYVISKGGREVGILIKDIYEFLIEPEYFDAFHEYMKGISFVVWPDPYSRDSLQLVSVKDYEEFINGLNNKE